MNEVWKDVLGWESLYEVSDLGAVRSKRRQGTGSRSYRWYGGGLVKPFQMSNGYLCVNLTKSGVRQQRTVHSLVLISFAGEPPRGQECCHNNGIRSDCRLSNLRWDTRSANHADKHLHGTAQIGERNGSHKLTDSVVASIRRGEMTVADAAAKCGASKETVRRAKRLESWRHVQ